MYRFLVLISLLGTTCFAKDQYKDHYYEKSLEKALTEEQKPLKKMSLSIKNKDLKDEELRDTLKNISGLTDLDLSGCSQLTDKSLKYLPKTLTNLTLDGCSGIEGQGLKDLACTDSLTTLSLNGCFYIKPDSVIELVKKCKKLTSLNIKECERLGNETIIKQLKNIRPELKITYI